MKSAPIFAAPLLCLLLASCAQSQPQARVQTPSKSVRQPQILPLRALIVSGGPSPDSNQYAIESNARYVEKLTLAARSQRILFADGNRKSRTIAAQARDEKAAARRVLAWLIDAREPDSSLTYRASTLRRIDGPATAPSIARGVRELARQVKPGERALLYFTGHGSPGTKIRLSLSGIGKQEDFDNTVYNAWDDGDFSTRDLAGALRDWPAKTPLVLVMVQCHSGGFANLLFEDAKPGAPVLKRDFCGFFAAIGERPSSGCTPEVDETDYQDFTTHFFAALSGISRDGRAISGADYDKNGAVSMLEAFAWTNLRDDSIDTPLCTSDAYLRSIWPTTVEPNWTKTPYSSLAAGAAPWQSAILAGLSKTLDLKGENRLETALQKAENARKLAEADEDSLPISANPEQVWARFDALGADVKRRFPGLKTRPNTLQFDRAQRLALDYLAARPADLKLLAGALGAWETQTEAAATREAQALRFVRAARTIWLEKRLKTQGTAAQKAIFARLRASESRNPLR